MQLRKDYILDRWVIVAQNRAQRPKEFTAEKREKKDKKCFFCPGNEDTTPPETGRWPEAGEWQMRWFPNKFPAVAKDAKPKFTSNLLTHGGAYGYHEVIVETPYHHLTLADLSIEQMQQLLRIYVRRIGELSKMDHIEYVHVFKNHGKQAGTSIIHSHSQIVAYNKVPELIKAEKKALGKVCPFCKIIKKEKRTKRKVAVLDHAVSFAPYASRFPYELWIFPKQHKEIQDLDDDILFDMAAALKQALEKLSEVNAPYNFYVHYSPGMHMHIELTPRMNTYAGFEIGSGDIINTVSPENAAAFYRGELE